MIWNDCNDIPIKIKKLFPKNEKNVSTLEEIIKTKNENFFIFFSSRFEVITANRGINDTGSIAMKVLKRFWRKISCIHLINL
tara:strand:+ start:694 stop:939 length:246 start_codon:yes stop_codon:yes gene_type:complete